MIGREVNIIEMIEYLIDIEETVDLGREADLHLGIKLRDKLSLL